MLNFIKKWEKYWKQFGDKHMLTEIYPTALESDSNSLIEWTQSSKKN
jgi:hypothetical protein